MMTVPDSRSWEHLKYATPVPDEQIGGFAVEICKSCTKGVFGGFCRAVEDFSCEV